MTASYEFQIRCDGCGRPEHGWGHNGVAAKRRELAARGWVVRRRDWLPFDYCPECVAKGK